MDGVVSAEDDDGGNVVFTREVEGILSDAGELFFEADEVFARGFESVFEVSRVNVLSELSARLVEGLAVDISGFEVNDGREHARFVDLKIVHEEVRRRLDDGADRGVFFICGELATSHHGQEEIIGVGGAHARSDAVEVLHGGTELDVAFVKTAFEVGQALTLKDFEVVA